MMIKTIKTKHKHGRFSELLDKESKTQQKIWRDFWEGSPIIPSARPYNLTIGNNPKFIWFRNAKVCTRSISQILDIAEVDFSVKEAFNCYYPFQLYQNYFKFAFVRNPWDRLVSCWHNKIIRRNSFNLTPELHREVKKFDAFVSYCSNLDLDICNHHIRRQCQLIDLNQVDFIGRFESFDEDIHTLLRILKLPEVIVPHANQSLQRKNYQSYYTDATRQIVADIYSKDIQLFHYEF